MKDEETLYTLLLLPHEEFTQEQFVSAARDAVLDFWRRHAAKFNTEQPCSLNLFELLGGCIRLEGSTVGTDYLVRQSFDLGQFRRNLAAAAQEQIR